MKKQVVSSVLQLTTETVMICTNTKKTVLLQCELTHLRGFTPLENYLLDIYTHCVYNYIMIKSFADKETELIYNQKFSKRLPTTIQKVALRKLMMIDNAKCLEDLRVPPSNHLEQLVGDRKGQHSIRINDQWRVCFTEKDGHYYNVEIVDYH